MKTEGKLKKKILPGLIKNKFALLILAVGLIFLLLPSGKKVNKEPKVDEVGGVSLPAFSLEEQEIRLKEQLSQIDGVGRVSVLLSVYAGASRELASTEEGILVLNGEDGEETVELYYVNPEYLGAVIVCDGAGSAKVRLDIMKAVASFTGLGVDSITISKMAGV